jgi:hypothetical protein
MMGLVPETWIFDQLAQLLTPEDLKVCRCEGFRSCVRALAELMYLIRRWCLACRYYGVLQLGVPNFPASQELPLFNNYLWMLSSSCLHDYFYAWVLKALLKLLVCGSLIVLLFHSAESTAGARKILYCDAEF